MLDLAALERQLCIRTHGISRRRELLDRAGDRLARDALAKATAYFEAGKDLVSIMDQRAALEAMREKYGSSKGPIGMKEDSVEQAGEVSMVVIDSNTEYERVNEFVHRTPLAHPGPHQAREPMAMSEAEALALSHADRALYIPGYYTLCALAQAQWMDQTILDEAVKRAARYGIIGDALADDLLGCVVDSVVLTDDAACARFSEMRRQQRAAMKEQATGAASAVE